MRKLFMGAVVAAGLLLPSAASTAQDPWDPFPCQSTGVGSGLCEANYFDDLSQCELGPSNELQGCRSEAAGNFVVCKANEGC